MSDQHGARASHDDGTTTVVSYNRPLTRGAHRELQEYGMVSEGSVNDYGRWSVVELEREPPADLLDRHELRIEREPDARFRTDHGEIVEVFDDAGMVVVDGVEQTISPDTAIEHAESQGWERVEA